MKQDGIRNLDELRQTQRWLALMEQKTGMKAPAALRKVCEFQHHPKQGVHINSENPFARHFLNRIGKILMKLDLFHFSVTLTDSLERQADLDFRGKHLRLLHDILIDLKYRGYIFFRGNRYKAIAHVFRENGKAINANSLRTSQYENLKNDSEIKVSSYKRHCVRIERELGINNECGRALLKRRLEVIKSSEDLV